MEMEVESIYKIMPNYFAKSWSHLHYPEFKTKVRETMYVRTLEEVEGYFRKIGDRYSCFKEDVPGFISNKYAYVVLEIPLGYETHTDVLGENLSTRIYLPDGSLWGENKYADFIPLSSHGDEYNYWGRRNMFYGHRPEEIKFKPGDIVEVFGYPGNHFWGNECVSLAIIVDVPPTIDEMSERRKQYLETHSGFDVCDHALCREFGNDEDTYKVLSPFCDAIDHAPTISVFNPILPVSSRRRNAMLKMYEKYLEMTKQTREESA